MTRWGKEKCLRNRLDKRHFWGLRGRETLNRPIPARLAAPWTKTGPNWAKTLPTEAGWSICGVEIGEAKWKFRIIYKAWWGRASNHSCPMIFRRGPACIANVG